MSRGTSRLVEFHATSRDTPRLGIRHVSCYSTSREIEDLHRHFLNFTHEYLCVTMRGQPRVSEVTLERYHMTLAIDKIDERGLINTARRICLPKKTKVMLY